MIRRSEPEPGGPVWQELHCKAVGPAPVAEGDLGVLLEHDAVRQAGQGVVARGGVVADGLGLHVGVQPGVLHAGRHR